MFLRYTKNRKNICVHIIKNAIEATPEKGDIQIRTQSKAPM